MIVLILCGMVFVVGVWIIIVNEITYKQRIAMIPDVGDPQFYEKLNRLRSVTYNQHMWRLATFRSAKSLYE